MSTCDVLLTLIMLHSCVSAFVYWRCAAIRAKIDASTAESALRVGRTIKTHTLMHRCVLTGVCLTLLECTMCMWVSAIMTLRHLVKYVR